MNNELEWIGKETALTESDVIAWHLSEEID
jgi:hypothetical protein